ncbi:hypothetical protein HDU97_001464 [Phlyctochytrium planicorne]|nr:hypothetical protein HDU97_001464 [Phlyctochytrium planicorne]
MSILIDGMSKDGRDDVKSSYLRELEESFSVEQQQQQQQQHQKQQQAEGLL